MASLPLEGSSKPETERSDPKNTTSRRWTPSIKTLAILVFFAFTYYIFYPTAPTSPSLDNDGLPFSREKELERLLNASRPLVEKPLSAYYSRPGEAYESSTEADAELEDGEFLNPLKRYSLEYGKVACWQNNGIWIKYLTPVEMDFLGVNRFQDTDRAPEHMQAGEDAFCARLRTLGASFWELPPVFQENVLSCWSIDSCADPVKMVSAEVGFPTNGSGVWVIDTGNEGWDWLKTVSLRNALTMDERCELIKGFGGVFCEDPAMCPEMARLLGDPVGLEGEGRPSAVEESIPLHHSTYP